MRVIDILSEASIFTKPKQYTFGHKVRVKTAKAGIPLMSGIQAQIPDFDPTEDLTWIAPPMDVGAVRKEQGNIPVVQIGRTTSGNARWFSRPNGTIFTVIGADGSLQGMLNHAPGEKGSTAENKGDASEPVLSAAVVAKLIKRGSDNIEDITPDDVKFVFNEALKDPNLEYVVEDKNSTISDIIRFTIVVKEPILGFLKSPGFWDSYDPLLGSVVHYANSGQIDRYADYFYKNGRVDTINVKSDGVSESKDRKTDLEAIVTDDEGNRRQLKNLNISLKAGSPHIGQVGAGVLWNPFADQYPDPKKPGKMKGQIGIWTAANKLFGPFGIQISKPIDENGQPIKLTSKVDFWQKAYQEAAVQFNEMLAADDVRSEAGLIYRIANQVIQHGTSGDSNIKLVSLGTKNVSTVHSFKGLERKLADKNIDLECIHREGRSKDGKEVRPEIRIIDKNSGKPVLFIRYSSTQTGDKIWNTIEMKDLLKELTTLTYKKTSVASDKPAQVTSTEIKPTVNKPVARKKHAIPPVDVTPVDTTASTVPTTTTLQGSEFTSPAPRQAGMPAKEEPAMMEQKIVHLKF